MSSIYGIVYTCIRCRRIGLTTTWCVLFYCLSYVIYTYIAFTRRRENENQIPNYFSDVLVHVTRLCYMRRVTAIRSIRLIKRYSGAIVQTGGILTHVYKHGEWFVCIQRDDARARKWFSSKLKKLVESNGLRFFFFF